MRKKVLFLILVLFIFPLVANAEGLCTEKKYSKLKAIAYKTDVSYELKKEGNDRYFEVTVTNVDKDVLVTFNDATYEVLDGTIKIPTKIAGGTTYEVKLYGGYDTDCPEEFLYSKKINVPKYNIYSERDECIEYEEFELCNKWYQGFIDDNTFELGLEKYIESIKPNEEVQEEKTKEKKFLQKIIDIYMDNLVVSIVITIIVFLTVIYVIIVKIIRRRKRIKLDM